MYIQTSRNWNYNAYLYIQIAVQICIFTHVHLWRMYFPWISESRNQRSNYFALIQEFEILPSSKKRKTNLNREKWPQTSHWLLKIRDIVDKFDLCIPKVFPLIYCCRIIKMERSSCLITIYKKLIRQSFAPGNQNANNKNNSNSGEENDCVRMRNFWSVCKKVVAFTMHI